MKRGEQLPDRFVSHLDEVTVNGKPIEPPPTEEPPPADD